MSPEKKFTTEEKEAMVAAIREAEKNTSGEIRIHIENHCKDDVLERAIVVFSDLKMFNTEQRNGVLLYFALEDRKLCIIGDVGINEKVPENFWDDIKNRLIEDIRQGAIIDGICRAVVTTGEQLKKWFPYQQDDVNELSDEISFNH